MAELNPPVQPQSDPNFTGYSRGSLPDTSIGGLFSDLAQTTQQGVRAATDIITENVRQDVYSAADEVRDTTINRLGGPPENATPEEVSRYRQNIDALRQSRRAGVLSDSHYWAQLDVETRRIRQKYPGHRHVVDQIVREVTGGDPANMLVNSLQAEMTGRRSTEQQQYEYWLKQATELGAPAAINYATRVQQGNPPSLLELQNQTAQIQRQRQQVSFSTSELALRQAQGQQVTREASSGAQQALYAQAGQLFAAGTGAIPQFEQRLAEYRRNPPNPAQLQELRAFFDSSVRGPLMNILTTTLHSPQQNGQTWGTLIRDQNEIQNISKTYTDFVNQLGESVSNGDWGLFTNLKLSLEAYQRGDAITLLQGQHGETFRRLQSLREVLGPQVFQNPAFLEQIPQLNNAIVETFRRGHVDGATNRTPLAETTQRDFAVTPAASDRGQLISARITSIVGDLVRPELAESGIVSYGEQLFGRGNINFLTTYVRNRPEIYNQIVGDARVHQNMDRIRNSNPELYQNYQNWVHKGFADSLRGVAADIRDNIQDPNSRANVVFSVLSGQYMYTGNNTATRNTVNQVNTAISGFTSYLRQQGFSEEDTTARVAQAVGRLPIDPNAGGRTGTWRAMFEQANNFIRMNFHTDETTGPTPGFGPLSSTGGRPEDYEPLLAEIRRGEAGQYGYTQAFTGRAGQRIGTQRADLVTTPLSDIPAVQRSMISDQIAAGVPRDMASSAVGAYQFTQEAFTRAMRLSGLDPSLPFEPKYQDRLAVALLQQRIDDGNGIDIQNYIQNPTQANEDRVVNTLAREWAAIPNTSGRGTHDGVAGNRANRSLDSIRRLVRGLAQQWSYNNP